MARRAHQASAHATAGFPKALAYWIGTDGELLRALTSLRRLGAEGDTALEALLAVRRVKELKLSWELWASLTEGDGRDPEGQLLDELPVHVVDQARLALWGQTWGH